MARSSRHIAPHHRRRYAPAYASDALIGLAHGANARSKIHFWRWASPTWIRVSMWASSVDRKKSASALTPRTTNGVAQRRHPRISIAP